jgi:NAD(P)-dependent dehydrogenase (short-subunit alcohol dehydrogenase family)
MARELENRCAIVTGASQGLGFEIAKKYLEAGASLLICARNERQLEEASSALGPFAGAGQSIFSVPADISNSRDVAMLVDRAIAHLGRVDILVNNAGVAGPIGPIESNDWEEWMRTIQINLFGAVMLCRAIMPHFKKEKHGKIIQLSGGGATQPLPMLSAYAASKAAVIRFIETLAEETRALHIDVNAIAPGALNTRMLEEFLSAGPETIGPAFHARSAQQKRDGGTPLCKGAELAVFLGSRLSDGITGKLISAVWDPWSALGAHIGDLNATDIYTLRRIVPRDRDMGWGDIE